MNRALLAYTLLLAACGGSDATDTASATDTSTGTSSDAAIDIAGAWVDAYGSSWDITTDTVRVGYPGTDPSGFTVASWDDAEGWIVARNDAANEYYAGLWSRFDWLRREGELYACQSVYDAADQEAAELAPRGDDTDLRTGCGGYPWSPLRHPLSVSGTWADSWGSQHLIDPFSWTMTDGAATSRFHIAVVDDVAGWVVAENDLGNAYNAGAWSRIEWYWDSLGALLMCQSTYDATSKDAALAAPLADRSDVLAGGCGGFAWTAMTPAVGR
ncbi:MAG: hypothetical protein RLZZ383_2054 [Pseudomonadota bacterium]|jgi:hypothetical protein